MGLLPHFFCCEMCSLIRSHVKKIMMVNSVFCKFLELRQQLNISHSLQQLEGIITPRPERARGKSCVSGPSERQRLGGDTSLLPIQAGAVTVEGQSIAEGTTPKQRSSRKKKYSNLGCLILFDLQWMLFFSVNSKGPRRQTGCSDAFQRGSAPRAWSRQRMVGSGLWVMEQGWGANNQNIERIIGAKEIWKESPRSLRSKTEGFRILISFCGSRLSEG